MGQRIFIGGQISAEGAAVTVAPGDVRTQTQNIYGFIQNVVEDAGGSLDDIVHVKICFKHEAGDDAATHELSQILDITAATFREPGPAVSAFGVDLLYPGLVLEIDAMAVIDGKRQAIRIADLGGRYQPPMFQDGIAAQGEIHSGGQVALGADGAVLAPGDVENQATIVFERLSKILAAADAALDDVVKLNLFMVGESGIEDAFHRVAGAWAALAPGAQPAMTPVRVHELAVPGLLIQTDAIAIK